MAGHHGCARGIGMVAALTGLALLAACSSSNPSSAPASSQPPGTRPSAASAGTAPATTEQAAVGGKIIAVGAENEYANVISQIGGRYVDVTAIMSNPNTDPHTFEASADVAKTVQAASLVVQNGLGYDDFMGKIEKASPNPDRKVIDVQKLRNLPNNTPNPHLWYDPRTMPAVAKELVADLSALQPDHAAYFREQQTRFLASMKTWTDAMATFKKQYGGTGVAVTEPVADYLIDAAGLDNKTPWSMQAAIMNDTDPAPQDIATQDSLFKDKSIKVFLYNQQVTDDITTKFLGEARSAGVPVVGVYETMPNNGYSYQSWMIAELNAIEKAIDNGTSTEKL